MQFLDVRGNTYISSTAFLLEHYEVDQSPQKQFQLLCLVTLQTATDLKMGPSPHCSIKGRL